MSVARSERNYKEAKTIFQDVRDDFYEIENADHPDEGFMIDQALEDVKKVVSLLGRINTDILLDKYDFDTVDIIEDNIEKMRKGSYFIQKSLMSMKMFDDLRPHIGQYIENVDWKSIADTEEEAERKLTAYLTSRDNYDNYKTIVNNIVKGTMKEKAFADLFYSINDRIRKPKKKRKPFKGHLHPAAHSEEGKEKWEKEKERARKAALKHGEDSNESFMTLSKYRKLLEYQELDNEEDYWEAAYNTLAIKEFGMGYDQLGPGEKEWVDDEMEKLLH